MKQYPDVKFYKLAWQVDENHYEIGYMYFGNPEKPFKEIVRESEEEFRILSVLGDGTHLSDILEKNLKENDYLKIIYEDSYFGEDYGDTSRYFKECLANDKELEDKVIQLIDNKEIVERTKEKYKISDIEMNEIKDKLLIIKSTCSEPDYDSFKESTYLESTPQKQKPVTNNPIDKEIDDFINSLG